MIGILEVTVEGLTKLALNSQYTFLCKTKKSHKRSISS